MTDGNHAQVRIMLDNVAEAAAATALLKYKAQQLDAPDASIPAPLKWAAGIIAALFTAGIATLAGWLIFSVSDMQVTLARMDERQALLASAQDGRFADIERRLTKLEGQPE